MALILKQPGVQPLGQFDGYDANFLTLLGGEVVTFVGVTNTVAKDKGASDSFDGYDKNTTTLRPVVTSTLLAGSAPLFLADDGTTGYGTLFGTVVGGTVGQVSTGGAVLGPHTATGSGKVTLWDKQGLYAVTLDACDATASSGLQPTNTSIVTGSVLYAQLAGGKLSPNTSAATTKGIGYFVEFETNGSLVNTPNSLVAALNSPSGSVSSAIGRKFTEALFWFAGAQGGI